MATLERPIVLLVEDDDQTRELHWSALHMAGFSVWVAKDGVSARRILERHTPDALVIDLTPLMSGAAVIEELHVSVTTRGIPIVVVSGMNMVQAPGAAVTLTKPVDPDDLVREVRKVLRGAPPNSTA